MIKKRFDTDNLLYNVQRLNGRKEKLAWIILEQGMANQAKASIKSQISLAKSFKIIYDDILSKVKHFQKMFNVAYQLELNEFDRTQSPSNKVGLLKDLRKRYQLWQEEANSVYKEFNKILQLNHEKPYVELNMLLKIKSLQTELNSIIADLHATHNTPVIIS